MKKFLIISAAVIAVIIIALTALVKIYVTPERVKGFVIPAAERSLNRKISVGDISISLFKGIGINDFAVKEADQQRDFVGCKEIVLKFKLLPLLSKKVVIDELTIVSPAVNIERGRDGAFNFEDIGQKKEPEIVKEKRPNEKAGGLPVSLLVNKIAVRNARFSVTDFMKKLPDAKGAADINISIESFDRSNIYTQGRIHVRLDEMDLIKPSGKRIRDIASELDYAAGINIESKDIHIDKAELKVRGIPASIKGDVRNLKTSPELDIAVNIPKVKTSELLELARLFADLKGLNLSGDVAADVRLQGELKKTETLKANGIINLEKVGIKYKEINSLLDGNIKLDDNLMNIDIKGAVGKNTAEIKVSVRNYLKNQDININVYSKQIFIDELIPAGKPADRAPAGGKRTAPGKGSKEAEPLDLKITATGEVKIESAVYRNMTMTDFYMQYNFRDNKLEIPKMSAKSGGGIVKLNSLIDLSRPGYAYNLSTVIKSVHADELVNSFFPKARDTVFGLISLNLKMNGAGTDPREIKKNLVADGDFNIKDGKITGAPITRDLSKFLSIDELETINLKQAKGKVNIKDGIARLDSIFTSDALAMDPSGEIGLDETLDLAFDLKLSPRLTDKALGSKIGRYIKNDKGWGAIPLKVSGTFAKPSYMVDIEKAGKRAIKKEAEKYIDKLFDKQDDKKNKELEPVKDLLKGIFK